jgi:hypothetical protein
MTEKEKLLWDAIKAFQFDNAIEEYGFVTRLAYENKWTNYFTNLAIEEYKKFIFLATISTQMVSPSEIVDIVWHQHLIFTQSYEKLSKITGRKIEHIPSTHNPQEHNLFIKAKNYTTANYENYFGIQNTHIWGNSFMNQKKFLIGNSPLSNRIIIILLLSVLAYLPLFYIFKSLIVTINNPNFIIGMFFIQLIFFAILNSKTQEILDEKAEELYQDDSETQNLSFFELMYLKTGHMGNYIHACMNEMIDKKKLSFGSDHSIRLNTNCIANNAYELTISNTIKQNNAKKYKPLFDQLKNKKIFIQTEKSILDFKFRIRNKPEFINFFSKQILFMLPVFYILLIRLQLGIVRDKNIVFLIFFIIVSFLINIAILNISYDRLFKISIPKLFSHKIRSNQRPDLKELWDWKYLVVGKACYAAAFLPIITYANHNASQSSNFSSGCGSSCGGCGGGCGGCGS